ncbi:MAG: divalent-cation tolerance protein CutA [candidate division Zixibacteria bacterium]|nr:divalent-cation tolerance protein CutA [candidate division Zixibacteria bacterium]MDH3938359.1 divalent-cation tolerance protein CutA [candidate division Zixibacteria bacterium]MDH4032710.1 divalent-cation tolerance protein CutA [candidate division Zixibacteria bacterium]
MSTDIRAVLVTIPRDKAQELACLIVENRLAACVNIVPRIESFYWWEGKVQSDDEALLIIKTTNAGFDALQQFVLDHHPYDLPEIVALPIDAGLDAYLKWVVGEVRK